MGDPASVVDLSKAVMIEYAARNILDSMREGNLEISAWDIIYTSSLRDESLELMPSVQALTNMVNMALTYLRVTEVYQAGERNLKVPLLFQSILLRYDQLKHTLRLVDSSFQEDDHWLELSGDLRIAAVYACRWLPSTVARQMKDKLFSRTPLAGTEHHRWAGEWVDAMENDDIATQNALVKEAAPKGDLVENTFHKMLRWFGYFEDSFVDRVAVDSLDAAKAALGLEDPGQLLEEAAEAPPQAVAFSDKRYSKSDLQKMYEMIKPSGDFDKDVCQYEEPQVSAVRQRAEQAFQNAAAQNNVLLEATSQAEDPKFFYQDRVAAGEQEEDEPMPMAPVHEPVETEPSREEAVLKTRESMQEAQAASRKSTPAKRTPAKQSLKKSPASKKLDSVTQNKKLREQRILRALYKTLPKFNKTGVKDKGLVNQWVLVHEEYSNNCPPHIQITKSQLVDKCKNWQKNGKLEYKFEEGFRVRERLIDGKKVSHRDRLIVGVERISPDLQDIMDGKF
eukprot:Clim_evm21s153 gene=Clim_evmTU21s153